MKKFTGSYTEANPKVSSYGKNDKFIQQISDNGVCIRFLG